mgnify:CR=1 FL=1
MTQMLMIYADFCLAEFTRCRFPRVLQAVRSLSARRNLQFCHPHLEKIPTTAKKKLRSYLQFERLDGFIFWSFSRSFSGSLERS